MIARLRHAFQTHPFVTAAFGLAVIATLAFALRAAVFAAMWSDPALRDQPIEGWMTPRYAGKARGLTRDQMIAALGDALPPPGEMLTLEQIAQRSGVPLPELIARIETAAGPRP